MSTVNALFRSPTTRLDPDLLHFKMKWSAHLKVEIHFKDIYEHPFKVLQKPILKKKKKQNKTKQNKTKCCKIQKAFHFTHFDQKNTHISGCKIVHKCTSAIVTIYICTVTIALAFNILVFFLSLIVSGCSHSPFFSFDQIIKLAKPLNLL